MARIFITGSSDGIGQAAAKLLSDQGHKVTLHARNSSRAKEAHAAVPNAEAVLVADISTIAGSKSLAAKANQAGPWDAVVHNAGLGPGSKSFTTEDGFGSTFAVNVLAPYVLTCLMEKPKRLLYLSSGLHASGSAALKNIERAGVGSSQAYNDSKLHDVMLANAVARAWQGVQSCSLDPGWVQTKMGGASAPGSRSPPAKMIAEYALGELKSLGGETGVYLNPQGPKSPLAAAEDTAKQDELLGICERLSGISLPK